MELIKHAAVKSEKGDIFIGKCHADCFHKGYELQIKMSTDRDAQGFITDSGRFICRGEAAILALENGQITKHTPILFSEDLWCNRDNGKHEYNEVEGYFIKSEVEE